MVELKRRFVLLRSCQKSNLFVQISVICGNVMPYKIKNVYKTLLNCPQKIISNLYLCIYMKFLFKTGTNFLILLMLYTTLKISEHRKSQPTISKACWQMLFSPEFPQSTQFYIIANTPPNQQTIAKRSE